MNYRAGKPDGTENEGSPQADPPRTTQINLWDIPRRNTIYTSFQTIDGRPTTRLARQEYCYRRFGVYFGHSVLDVGCDEGIIRDLHEGLYVGVDLYGEPEVRVDLERMPLPFGDASFDTVLCIEVLEHIGNLHELFEELMRVSRHRVIISLPNCWRQLMGDMMTGAPNKLEYGLPPEKPGDRHKWFFNTREAMRFVEAQARHHRLRIVEIEHVSNAGSLFNFNMHVLDHVFHYPPLVSSSQMSPLDRAFTVGAVAVERVMELLLLRGREWRRQMRIVNTWFVLERSPEDA